MYFLKFSDCHLIDWKWPEMARNYRTFLERTVNGWKGFKLVRNYRRELEISKKISCKLIKIIFQIAGPKYKLLDKGNKKVICRALELINWLEKCKGVCDIWGFWFQTGICCCAVTNYEPSNLYHYLSNITTFTNISLLTTHFG